ncbi:Chitin deacetylase 5, partial [Caligus rogercresseyi]
FDMKTFILLGILSTACLLVASKKPERCDPSYCKLPDCYCGGQDIPGGLSKDEIPQFVLLTFDDAVNNLNKKFFEKLFKGRTNPNGCPIKDLYADGHEIASHTVTHSHGSQFGEEKWANEIVGEAEMLVRYAGVNPQDIKGMRAPFLAIGGDTMFNTLNRYGFYYDSSMSVAIPSWPYTLEYRMPHSCAVKPCPEQSHPGMWEVPMTTIKDIRGGTCSMADGCFYEEKATSIQRYSHRTSWSTTQSPRLPSPSSSTLPGSSTGHTAWTASSSSSTPSSHSLTSISSQARSSSTGSATPSPWTQSSTPPSLAAASLTGPHAVEEKKAKCQLKHKGDVRQFATCQTTCPNRYPWVSNLNGD